MNSSNCAYSAGSAGSPRRSRRLAGMTPEVSDKHQIQNQNDSMNENFYPNRTPRKPTVCTNMLLGVAGFLGSIVLTRAVSLTCSRCF